jgi:hypothetical protein
LPACQYFLCSILDFGFSRWDSPLRILCESKIQ